MKINRNMSAVITNKQLLRTERKLTSSMERLSSGLKINAPGDNPSGMAISNKMRAQIRGLDQSESNTTDAISVMQIADGALNETTSILQRMRELSVQAANGTNSESDRESIQAEIDQLVKEVDRISEDTEYNTKVLLDGSSDTRVYATPKDASRINISDQVPMGIYEVEVEAQSTYAETTIPDLTALGVDGVISINGVEVGVKTNENSEEYIKEMRDAIEAAGGILTEENSNELTFHSRLSGSAQELTITYPENIATALGVNNDATWSYDETTQTYSKTFTGTDAVVNKGEGLSETTTITAEGNRIHITDQGGFSIDFLLSDGAHYAGEEYTKDGNTITSDGIISLEVSDVGRMVIQTGANEYQTIDVRIPEVSSESMYLDTIDVTVYKGPEDAMRTMDDAIAYINDVRAKIGAYQNRLEYTENSLSATNENMTSAYSTLMDTDMAEEMAEYTQQNVLEQAAISVLSQANEIPQQVLSLLS
ncbi:MAG: flagellin [Lachnospiraceae bacterium]|nr:flagellin [Lachnospiraceae bacterium]